MARDAQAAAAAVGEGENDAGMLQALQESIRDFIRDIGITNFDNHQPQQPPAEDDENDSEFD